MRQLLLAAALALTPSAGAVAEKAEDGVAAVEDDRAVLTQIKTELWPKAYRTQDVELLDRLLHESFLLIDDAGARSTKADELAAVAAEPWDPGAFEYRIERLDIYGGDVAIIAGQGVAERYSYRSSNVLVKEDGIWRAIASHVSGVEARETAE